MSVAKAQAAMTAPTTNPTNMQAQREGFFNQCASFGTNAGAGDTSKIGFFQATVEAAWQGIIGPAGRRKKGDITSPPTDPEIAYDRFANARKAKAVQACFEGEISVMAPASILRRHAGVTVYLDRQSARLLGAETLRAFAG